MRLRLEGGPFDGYEVGPTEEGVAIPDNLGFDRRGHTTVGAKPPVGGTLPQAEWRLIDPRVPPEVEAQTDPYYTAHYRRTERVSPEGWPVFEFYHPLDVRRSAASR